jgi:peptide deformylase
MGLKIVQAGEKVLRQRATALTVNQIRSRETQQLIEAMRQTMHEAPGVGLAAPQIDLPLQLAVIEDKAEYHRDTPAEFIAERDRKPVAFHVIVNPVITLEPGDEAVFFEGCLSVAGATAVVPRARRVRVDCLDHKGKPRIIDACGWYARILQHEIDHLYGTLYVDRMLTRTFMTVDNFTRLWKYSKPQEWGQLLAGSSYDVPRS